MLFIIIFDCYLMVNKDEYKNRFSSNSFPWAIIVQRRLVPDVFGDWNPSAAIAICNHRRRKVIKETWRAIAVQMRESIETDLSILGLASLCFPTHEKPASQLVTRRATHLCSVRIDVSRNLMRPWQVGMQVSYTKAVRTTATQVTQLQYNCNLSIYLTTIT